MNSLDEERLNTPFKGIVETRVLIVPIRPENWDVNFDATSNIWCTETR